MNTLSVKEKIYQDLGPAAISGAVSLLGYSLLFGEPIMGSIPIFGSSAPAALVVGGTVFASHLAGNVLENQVLSMLQSAKMAGLEGAIAKPLISGLSTYGIFKFGVSDNSDFIRSFGLGSGSVMAGSYISENLFDIKKKF